MIKLWLSVIFLLISGLVSAEGTVVINDSNKGEPFQLRGNLFYYIDSSEQYTFSDVLSEAFRYKLTQADNPKFLFKKNSKTIWFKIEIENKTDELQHLILAINNPLINSITYYSSIDSVYFYTGFNHVFNQRQIKHRNYLFNIHLKPGEKGTYCIRVQGQDQPMFIPISLNPEQFVIKKMRMNSFLHGILYTVVLIFILIIFMLWKTEKDQTYIYLLFLVSFIAVSNLWREGFLFQYIWPNSPQFNFIFGRTLFPLIIPLLLMYSSRFMKIQKSKRIYRRYIKTLILLSFLFVFIQLIIYSFNFYFIVFRTLAVLFLIAIVWGLLFKKKKKALFFYPFLLALLFLTLDFVMKLFFSFDIKGIGATDQQFTSYIIVAFFTLGVYVFMQKFRSSRFEVIELNKNLEKLVDNRTLQLNSQKEELKSQHEELILQKETLQSQREELRAQKELLEVKNTELEKLSLVASKTDNLIYIFGASGELNWFNSSFSLNLGMSLEEYQRGEPLNIIDVSSNKNIRHVLNTCLREKSVVSYESMYTDKNGHNKWFHTTLTPILDDRENIKHLIAIDTDITRLKQYEEELNQQRKDAEHQKNLAVQRKEELEERQIEVTDSIRYAKRIQTAIMPKIKQIQRDFHDSFVLFLPKDIVSGDFYWYHRINDKYFVAAVDCTGHGVPGAFMSIIGNYLLNSIIIHNGVEDPAEILKQLNRKIKIALKADSRSQTSDGMDISIVIIDKNKNTIDFASALRPMYLFSDGDFIEVKGDKIPITSNISGTSISSFTNFTYPFNVGDKFYMFSDGIIDQFGGKSSKKFLTKRFKQLLFEINPLTMREQKEIIKKAFDDWKGENEQVDDVLVLGIKYS